MPPGKLAAGAGFEVALESGAFVAVAEGHGGLDVSGSVLARVVDLTRVMRGQACLEVLG